MEQKSDQNDKHVMALIHKVVDRGGSVQVKKNTDGTLKVQEIKVHTVVG